MSFRYYITTLGNNGLVAYFQPGRLWVSQRCRHRREPAKPFTPLPLVVTVASGWHVAPDDFGAAGAATYNDRDNVDGSQIPVSCDITIRGLLKILRCITIAPVITKEQPRRSWLLDSTMCFDHKRVALKLAVDTDQC